MNKILTIQILRGIAALLIVFSHACHDTFLVTDNSWLENFYSLQYFGYIGLDLFFVISGFIILFIHKNDFLKPNAMRDFIIKRAIRIVPLYWLFTAFAVSILIFFPELFTKGKTFDFEHILASLFFFPWYNSIGEISPVLGVGWTLNVEMYFYLIFALTLLLPKKYFLMSISFVLLFGVLLFNIIDVSFPYFIMIGKPILLNFLIGVYIGWLYIKGVKLRNAKMWLTISLLIIFSNIFLHVDEAYRVLYKGIPSAILIYSLLSLEQKYGCKYCNKYLIILGNASYSIYITHAFFYKGAIKLFDGVQADVLILISVLFSILGGVIVYSTIEKPLYIFMKTKYSNYLTNQSKANNE